MKAQQLEIGMVGLGVIGPNLLLNLADHEHSATGYDKGSGKVAALRFGEVKVETHGEQHVFEGQVCLNAIDPKVVRVELYADGVFHETY